MRSKNEIYYSDKSPLVARPASVWGAPPNNLIATSKSDGPLVFRIMPENSTLPNGSKFINIEVETSGYRSADGAFVAGWNRSACECCQQTLLAQRRNKKSEHFS